MKIEKLYCFMIIDKDGDEGICGFKTDEGWMPMVGADLERMDSIEIIAKSIANSMNETIFLLEFTDRKEIKQIKPDN